MDTDVASGDRPPLAWSCRYSVYWAMQLAPRTTIYCGGRKSASGLYIPLYIVFEVMRKDYPRTLSEFEARFLTERVCRAYLAQLRWPDGFACPRPGTRYKPRALAPFFCAVTRHTARNQSPNGWRVCRMIEQAVSDSS